MFPLSTQKRSANNSGPPFPFPKKLLRTFPAPPFHTQKGSYEICGSLLSILERLRALMYPFPR